jgi:hypothetical protein
MKRALAIAFVLLLASAFVAAQKAHPRRGTGGGRHAVTRAPADQSGWEGSYEFSEGGGSAGGMAMIVTHTLSVRKQGDSLVCDLNADGYQTSTSLSCIAREEGGKLNIYFDSYREGNIFERFRKGQLLLSLEKAVVDGKPRLLTYWGAYQPALKDLPSGRVYFKRTK